MKIKRVETAELPCTTSALRPFGCMELWAGNEKAQRSLEIAGLETDVIAIPCEGDAGGDLAAIFSCSDNIARIVLADCVGHGYMASGVARHIHKLLHKFHDIRDTAALLASLNDEFTLGAANDDQGLRLTTIVTGTYDGTTGEFTFAYAAHPRMLVWRAAEKRFYPIGEGMENFPLGLITGEQYSQQSIRLGVGDMVLAFSDGAIEAQSPDGAQLTSVGFLGLAADTLQKMSQPVKLQDFSQRLLDGVLRHRGGAQFEDDVTLLTVRRIS